MNEGKTNKSKWKTYARVFSYLNQKTLIQSNEDATNFYERQLNFSVVSLSRMT